MQIEVQPAPTELEAAAIMCAYEALWPRPAVESTRPPTVPTWRFSGRWWSAPLTRRPAHS